jgi:hypothetical protein
MIELRGHNSHQASPGQSLTSTRGKKYYSTDSKSYSSTLSERSEQHSSNLRYAQQNRKDQEAQEDERIALATLKVKNCLDAVRNTSRNKPSESSKEERNRLDTVGNTSKPSGFESLKAKKGVKRKRRKRGNCGKAQLKARPLP